jgi:hypothetical protein
MSLYKDHCVDILRQVLMYAGDVGGIIYYWEDGRKDPCRISPLGRHAETLMTSSIGWKADANSNGHCVSTYP